MFEHNISKGMTELGRIIVKIAQTRSSIVFWEQQFKLIQEHMEDGITKHELLVQHCTNIVKEHEELEELLTKQFLLGD